ncbi:MAG: hypothetical protein LAC70_00630 [Methylovulum sp.]|nr:hypothetical protein [Methylovulum sp.]
MAEKNNIGDFDYQEAHLEYIAERLEHDSEYNNNSYDNPVMKEGDHHYGFELEPKTIEFMRDVINQLRQLETILREYDLAISGDTCEKTFQERVGIK